MGLDVIARCHIGNPDTRVKAFGNDPCLDFIGPPPLSPPPRFDNLAPAHEPITTIRHASTPSAHAGLLPAALGVRNISIQWDVAAAYRELGWQRTGSGWRNSDPDRVIIFLGDFIDRGPENAAVLRLVRSLIDAGKAQAVMGNHELNALHYHTPCPGQGREYLRPHTEKNAHQHASFLKEFPLAATETKEVLNWMRHLPLYLELDSFRAVHACWEENVIEHLKAQTDDGILTEQQLLRSADKNDPLFHLVEVTTKGPEVRLPIGYSFQDKDGNDREYVRIKWWQKNASSWADLAMSVPDPTELPINALPASVCKKTYPQNAKPVFFGHYWLTGKPALQASNALCLDYSAGKDGPLLAYRLETTDPELSTENIFGLSIS